MITFATLLWDANQHSMAFSKMYDESWVEKLYRGFERNTTHDFEFVCFVDREREFSEPIKQEIIATKDINYGCCVEPYKLGVPMILVGLDTIIRGNIDALVDYCFEADVQAVPRDPYHPHQACNGAALVPKGQEGMWSRWRGENDMAWVRTNPHVFIDDLFEKQVVSYKGHVKPDGLGDARIVYFHGQEKPHQLVDSKLWIQENWR